MIRPLPQSTGRAFKRLALLAATLPLMGCSGAYTPKFLSEAFPGLLGDAPAIQELETDTQEQVLDPEPGTSTALLEDEEQPEIFQATDLAMWDGRPTLGDIWVSVPGALQPERVMIRHDETGLEIKGAMFVADAPTSKDAPIRLSPGAAKALGITPLEIAKISVTAIRREAPTEPVAPVVARSNSSLTLPMTDKNHPGGTPSPLSPLLSFADPFVEPKDNRDGFVEVAQTIDPLGAHGIKDELFAASIPAEIQEDYIEGRSVYRIYASSETDPDTLGGTLQAIRFVESNSMGEVSTQIAEMPNFSIEKETEEKGSSWVFLEAFGSRNEAMATVQKLARKSIPAEVCTTSFERVTTYHVFAGPAADVDTQALSDGEIQAAHAIENKSFCMGVAAAQADSGALSPIPVSAPLKDKGPIEIPQIPEGAVRIRVGEGTGSLKLRVPNPYSQPVQIPVSGFMMSLPMNTPQDLVERVRKALLEIDAMDVGSDEQP